MNRKKLINTDPMRTTGWFPSGAGRMAMGTGGAATTAGLPKEIGGAAKATACGGPVRAGLGSFPSRKALGRRKDITSILTFSRCLAFSRTNQDGSSGSEAARAAGDLRVIAAARRPWCQVHIAVTP